MKKIKVEMVEKETGKVVYNRYVSTKSELEAEKMYCMGKFLYDKYEIKINGIKEKNENINIH